MKKKVIVIERTEDGKTVVGELVPVSNTKEGISQTISLYPNQINADVPDGEIGTITYEITTGWVYTSGSENKQPTKVAL